MKNILIIAYEFYPINTGGSHRPYRFATYLKKNNFNPIVITVKVDINNANYDYSLKDILTESNIEVITIPINPRDKKSNILDKYYFNVIEDTFRRWKKNLIPVVKKTIQTRKIIGVIITAPPFSITNLVFDIRKEFDSIPIYFDMRDAWSNWNLAPYASIFHYWATLNKEKKIFKLVDKIILTSKITMNDLIKLNTKTNPNKFIYIPNSFDNYIDNKINHIKVPPKGKIRIGYFGSFYYNPESQKLIDKKWHHKPPHQWLQYTPIKENWLYRSPYFIFKSLKFLFLKFPEYKTRISLHFVGIKSKWLLDMIYNFGLESNIKLYGKLEHNETLKIQRKMDYLLITSSKREGGKDYSIAGKTFEYLSLQKPIIGFLTDSAQKDILKKTGVMIPFDPDNIEESSQLFKTILDDGVELIPSKKNIENHLTSNSLSPLINLISDTFQ